MGPLQSASRVKSKKNFFAAAPAGIKEHPYHAEYHVKPCSFKRADGDVFIPSTFILLPGNAGKFNTGQPCPAGLSGIWHDTVLLNLHNAGLFHMDVTLLAMGIFYGGMARLLADLLAFKNHTTFGLTGLYLLRHVLAELCGDSATTGNGSGESATAA